MIIQLLMQTTLINKQSQPKIEKWLVSFATE